MSLCGIYRLLGLSNHFSPWLPLFSFLCVAVFEETIFRGVIFRLAESRYGSLAALVLSSAVFGLLHLLNVAAEPIPLDQKLLGPVLICLEAGLLLGAAYMATRRLWLPIGIHWAWNFFEGPVYGTDVSGNTAERNVLMHSSLHGPFLAERRELWAGGFSHLRGGRVGAERGDTVVGGVAGGVESSRITIIEIGKIEA